jgi:DNA polymerase-3 subunit epsilon
MANDDMTGVAASVDIETTGLDPAKHEVVELALVLFTFNRKTGEITGVTDEYSSLRDPGRPIPRSAAKVHGLTDRDVAGHCPDEGRVRALLSQAEYLVAHNARFDRNFLVHLFPECGEKPWLCSMQGIGWKRAGFASKALQNLLSDNNITPDESHRACGDAKSVIRLLSLPDQKGKPYFKRLLKRGPVDFSEVESRNEPRTRSGPATRYGDLTVTIAGGSDRLVSREAERHSAKPVGCLTATLVVLFTLLLGLHLIR